MQLLLKVNKKFFFLGFMLIIFLTGCAPKGYHSGDSIIGKSPDRGGVHSQLSGVSFLWPMRGKIIAPYGTIENEVALNGMVIESHDASDVRAARDGRVVLIDQNLKGYGKTIILEHSDDFSTVYARNSEILVKLGQPVHQGESIAKAGKRGGVFAQMYFELRKNLKAENPVPHLKDF